MPIEIWMTIVEADDDQQLEKTVVSNDGVVITRSNPRIIMMTVESVRARHRGNYTCWAKNKAGVSSYSAQLAMNG
jgi:hypothetical protein